jgi:outer membrane immunogenic protein
MKKFLLAGIAAAAFCVAPAFAADMPTKGPVYRAAPDPVVNWTGCYIGGNVGGGWGTDDWVFPPNHLAHNKTDGIAGGGQIGCDYQAGNWVLGVRGMIDASNLNKTAPNLFNNAFTMHSKVGSFETATARLGVLINPQWLVYVDGGGAWARTKRFEDLAGVFQWSMNNGSSGWVIGGGIEYKFAPNWSWFLEYDHIDFGSKNSANSQGSPSVIKQDINTVLFGLNYRFGYGGKGPVVAKY